MTGKVIVGATMQLYRADTALNRSYGREPHLLVSLPVLPGFPPNQNRVPQPSFSAGGEERFLGELQLETW